MALTSMLSRLSFTTFVEYIASTKLLLSKTASVSIDCGDNNKISSIIDAKRACSIASCKLRASDAMVEGTIPLIFFVYLVSGQVLSWLSTRKMICASTLLTPSFRFAWAASENNNCPAM